MNSVELSLQEEIYILHNRIRKEYNLPPFKKSEELEQKAIKHSVTMASYEKLFHSDYKKAENVGCIPATQDDEHLWSMKMMEGWKRSEHFLNITNSKLTVIGVGVALDSYGNPWFTVIFDR